VQTFSGSASSIAIIAVIIFVVLAGGSFASAFFSYMTFPVTALTVIALCAEIANVALMCSANTNIKVRMKDMYFFIFPKLLTSAVYAQPDL